MPWNGFCDSEEEVAAQEHLKFLYEMKNKLSRGEKMTPEEVYKFQDAQCYGIKCWAMPNHHHPDMICPFTERECKAILWK